MGLWMCFGLGGGLAKKDNPADNEAKPQNFRPMEGFSEVENTDGRDESGSDSRPDGIDRADFEIL